MFGTTKPFETKILQYTTGLLLFFTVFVLLSQLVVLQIFLITEHLEGVVEHDALQLIKRRYIQISQESLSEPLAF